MSIACNKAEKPIELMALANVLAEVPVSKSSIYSAIQSGDFPAPLKFGKGGRQARALWVRAEIEEWKRSLLKKREVSHG